MANNRYCGTITDYHPISEDNSRVIVMYGLSHTNGDMVEWYQIDFYKKKGYPDFEQVKDAILADINERVKNKIIGGFVWNDKPVWLSEENQMNFAQAVVPATFKIGEEEDGTPIYQEFTTNTDLKNFVEACVLWKQTCLSDGWQEKDAIDWEPYEQALNPKG